MKKPVFTGAAVAIITPFKSTGEVDYEEFGKIIDHQIAHGTDAIVVCGTTGEASALHDKEHREALAWCCEYVNHRVPVVAGTGSNDTAYAIELTKFATECGADAGLSVTPYYNKTTQRGLIAHYTAIADCSDLPISEDADYVYICENNTIYGTKFKTLPNTKGKDLVADVSSCFLSEPVDVTKYAMIYGGVQKNIGPAGVVIAIIREDLITEDVLPGTPTMLTYKTHADAKSLYNTPPAYGIYICGKVFKWLKKMGGLEVMKERNEKKAKVLYDFLDQSKLFKGTVVPEDRSLMNVPFVTGDADLDAKFVKEAKEAGFDAVEVHGAHGYLIGAFASPFSNKRSDEYGGTIRNRARFAMEIIENIKEKCGKDYPVLYRMSAVEYVPGGLEIEES